MEERKTASGFEDRRKACDDALQELVSYAKMGFDQHFFNDTRYRTYAVTSMRIPMSTQLSTASSCGEVSDGSAFGYEFDLELLRAYNNKDVQLRSDDGHRSTTASFHDPNPPPEVGDTLRTVYEKCKGLVINLVSELNEIIDIRQANAIPLLSKDGEVYTYRLTRKYEDLMLPINASDKFYRLYAYLTFYSWVKYNLFEYNSYNLLFALGMVCQVHLNGDYDNLQSLLHLCAMASKRCSTFPYSFSNDNPRTKLYAKTFAPGVYIRYTDGKQETEAQKTFRTKLHIETQRWFEELLSFRGYADWNDYTQTYSVIFPSISTFGRRHTKSVKFGRNRRKNSRKSTPRKKRTSRTKRKN